MVQGNEYDLTDYFMPNTGPVQFSERNDRLVHVAMMNEFFGDSEQCFSELLDVADNSPEQLYAGTATGLDEKEASMIADGFTIGTVKVSDTKVKKFSETNCCKKK